MTDFMYTMTTRGDPGEMGGEEFLLLRKIISQSLSIYHKFIHIYVQAQRTFVVSLSIR